MSFSYFREITASGTNYIDFTRWKIDDIDSTAYEVNDEEITVLYNEIPTTFTQIQRNYLTAIKVADYLATKYKKQATFSSAGTSMNLKERADAWQEVVDKLRLEYLQVTGISAVMYPNRPHYDANVTIDEAGWMPYGRW